MMKAYLTAIVMYLGLSGSVVWAAMDAGSTCGMMQQQFEQMQGTMGQAGKTKDNRSHQKLMEEHMRQMQKGMGMMSGMMHDGMMQGGKGGMMQGGKGNMMQGGKSGMMQDQSAGMMSPEMMSQRMEHLQQRMDMMQQMMQQMMDHMAEQERMSGK